MKNKQGKVYGLKFTYDGHSFKASEIGREFGFRTLPKQFEIGNAQKSIIPSSHSSGQQMTPLLHKSQAPL